MKILIMGGVAGGASAAARLRRLDEKAEIIIFEKGENISFANCGLPYYIGGDIKKKSSLILQTPQSFHARFNIDVRVNNEVMSIDPQAKTVSVKETKTGETYEETYDKLVLSPGAKPVIPNIKGINNERVFTLRNIPDTLRIKEYLDDEFPDSAVIIGAGYIGLEMAENLKLSGVDVSVVERAEHVMAPLDYDMACEVHKYIKEKGIKLILKNGVKSIDEVDGRLSLELEKGSIQTDMVILCVGVAPDTEVAKKANLVLNEKGAICVDEHMLTSDKNIYAVGDAVEVTDFVTTHKAHIPLAGPANKQGRIVADNICGRKTSYKNTQGSSILKLFDMTVATTGINEATAQAAHVDYDKVFTFSNSHAAYYPGSTGMSIKTIYEKETGRILGAQIVGFEGVDKRCDVLATAIRAGMTGYDLTELELCYAPPFGSAKDPVNFVGYVIENILEGYVKVFNWSDIEDLPRDGSVTLLDVRTSAERAEGAIEGFMHIPVDELRQRISEIDPEKPVYIHCRTGLRSYIACRILSDAGMVCYNLSGGYRLYETILLDKKSSEHPCY